MSDSTALRLGKVGTVMLGVKNVSRSLPFYRDTLGLNVQFASPEFVFLDGGGVTLALSAPLGKSLGSAGSGVELVFAVDDVCEAHRVLSGRGVVFHQDPRQVTPTDWAANFVDPDGHQLSIFGPPGDAATS